MKEINCCKSNFTNKTKSLISLKRNRSNSTTCFKTKSLSGLKVNSSNSTTCCETTNLHTNSYVAKSLYERKPEYIYGFQQRNSDRYFYILMKKKPERLITYVYLKNGYYIIKIQKTRELNGYSDSDLYKLIKTVLIMGIFKVFPRESIEHIISTGDLTWTDIHLPKNFIKIQHFSKIVDGFFGKGFSSLISKLIVKFYDLYVRKLIYVSFGQKLKLPTASEVILLFEFMNIDNVSFSPAVKFLRS